MTQRLFITATGTGIGKTWVTTQLIRQLLVEGKTVRALKPVLSGYTEDNVNDITEIQDALRAHASGKGDNVTDISLYRLKAALSPDMAARAESVQLEYKKILEFCQPDSTEDYLLIEGIGGVMVPLTDTKTVLDLMADLKIPALLVAGSYLGSISHTLTAWQTLASRGIPMQAVVVSASEGEDHPPLEGTIATLKNFVDVPIMTLPRKGIPQRNLAKGIGLIA